MVEHNRNTNIFVDRITKEAYETSEFKSDKNEKLHHSCD